MITNFMNRIIIQRTRTNLYIQNFESKKFYKTKYSEQCGKILETKIWKNKTFGKNVVNTKNLKTNFKERNSTTKN